MADTGSAEPRLTGNVPLYKNVEPLNRQKHKGWGVKQADRPFDFLKDNHFVPAIAGEFARASASYPVIFLGERRMPVIVMGLRNGQNFFVDANGQFDGDHYAPAYVRRYPFVSASSADGQPSTVCIDADASFVVQENPEQPFFDDKGEPTQYTQSAIEYVSAFEADVAKTEAFVERLLALDLFEEKTVNVANPQDQNNPIKVAEYWGVSPTKLAALPADTVVEMNQNGELGAIYAHLSSLNNWERVLRRASLEGAAQAPAQA